MSIQSEINRISGYRDDSYDAVEDMGGTLPQSATMENLPTAIRSIPQSGTPYDSNPAMDGTASPGVSDAYARGDHVHPTDTSRAAAVEVITVSGSTPSITAVAGKRYICGEVSTLTIAVPASGIIDVVFESGTTATVLTITPASGSTVSWANGFDPTSLDASSKYELNIMDGLGVAASWT